MQIHSFLLPVADPQASQLFYARLLDMQPVESSPGFVLFVLPPGIGFGLWRRDSILPAPQALPGCAEIGFKLDEPAAVDAAYAVWRGKGAAMALPPSNLDFGRSFVALDPDGHRLRVYAMTDAA